MTEQKLYAVYKDMQTIEEQLQAAIQLAEYKIAQEAEVLVAVAKVSKDTPVDMGRMQKLVEERAAAREAHRAHYDKTTQAMGEWLRSLPRDTAGWEALDVH